ncbi:sensor histidine kinase [Paenibacillus pinistramenti]|uniref:sensor histidine kinase n=1 Tax=Paenibacillus pinistramenti TaxID=1768003 RepID=UPI001EF022E2|nr:sensor histidine kinase [Paenibacillus pinistramenti]
MSIKRKMILLLFVSLSAMVLLNMVLVYNHGRNTLRGDYESRLISGTRQAAVSLEQSRFGSNYAEQDMEKDLYRAAQTAAGELASDWSKVTLNQLTDLSRRTGVSGFSLLYMKDSQVQAGLSTDPLRLGKPVNNYADVPSSYFQPFAHPPGPQDHGPHWTDTYSQITGTWQSEDRMGFYYDGRSNYMVNVFIRPDDANRDLTRLGLPAAMNLLKQNDSTILEITGLRIERNELRLMERNDSFRDLVLYGGFQFPDPAVDERIKAAQRGPGLVTDLTLNGKHYLQSYVPVTPLEGPAYVLRMVYSYDPLLTELRSYLKVHILALVITLLVLLLVVYITAGWLMRPFRSILAKLKEMSKGRFGPLLQLKNRDEFGLLANHINVLAESLSEYTSKMEKINLENRSMREYLESVINQTADAIHLSDPNWRILRVNHAFAQLYGWKEDEIAGRELPFVPSGKWQEWEEWERELASGEQLPWEETLRLRKDGTEVEVSISHSPVFNKNGTIIAYITISRDMTEHNRMQELLRRSEKLTTVGQLAAGVAHEIRNPLTTLRGFLQLQQQTKKFNSRHVDIMLSELDRINLIVSEFLILAKPQASHFQDKDIRYVLGDVISLLDSEAHLHGIEFVSDFSKDPVIVHCEENQLKQVFINILKNAMEAMPRGGGIGLKVIKEGGQALIGIIDEGEGIPFEKISKLGEPFYTSKEKGTGLGLMISQRIIETHRGTFNINSMVGWGTMVTITLPLAEASSEDPDGRPGPHPGSSASQEG